jgi:predicted dehydrogenase
VLLGAFIGFGNVAAQGHLPGWRSCKDIRIVAATDVQPARRDAFIKACPDGLWHESADDLLSGERLDFVDICSPPNSHAALIEQALQAGLHVLCEKPLVTEPEDARRVAAAAASARRVVHTVHNWLKAPMCLKVSALIDESAIGCIRLIRWRTVRTGPAASFGKTNWRLVPAIAGGGILFDHGWHALYCVARWAGAPRALAAVLENRRFHEWALEDTATLTLDFASGIGEIFLTWAGEERSNSIEIAGDHGQIDVAGDRVTLKNQAGTRHWSCPPSLSEGSHHHDWFASVADDFRNAATEGEKGNLQEALLCSRLIDLAQRSHRAGGVRLLLDV